MHTNWCVFIKISMETGMLNILSGIIGQCTDRRISLYQHSWQYDHRSVNSTWPNIDLWWPNYLSKNLDEPKFWSIRRPTWPDLTKLWTQHVRNGNKKPWIYHCIHFSCDKPNIFTRRIKWNDIDFNINGNDIGDPK